MQLYKSKAQGKYTRICMPNDWRRRRGQKLLDTIVVQRRVRWGDLRISYFDAAGQGWGSGPWITVFIPHPGLKKLKKAYLQCQKLPYTPNSFAEPEPDPEPQKVKKISTELKNKTKRKILLLFPNFTVMNKQL